LTGGKAEDKSKDKKTKQEKRVSEIDKQIAKLMDLYSLDKVPFNELSAKIDALHKEKSAILGQINKDAESNPKASISASEFRSLIAGIADVWDIADIEQRRYLLSSLIKRIVIDDEDIVIEWTFAS